MTSVKSIIKLSIIKGAGEGTVYPYCFQDIALRRYVGNQI